MTDQQPETATAHDDEDIRVALGRVTADGPGFESEDELPPSNFAGYATDDVEEPE